MITKRGSVGRKHKEEVIERAQDNSSRVTFPAADVHDAYGVAGTSVGA